MPDLLFPQPSLDDLVAEGLEIIARAKERFQPVLTVALFSGGKDSTCMVHLVKDQIDAVGHIVTGIGLPEATQFVEEFCRQHRLPLIKMITDPAVYRERIVLGQNNRGFPGPGVHHFCYHKLKSNRLEELERDILGGGPRRKQKKSKHPGANGRGFPGPRQHHITYHKLKQERLQELQRDRSKKGQRILLVSGVRSLESKRRMVGIGKHSIEAPRGRLTRCAWANPIAGWTSKDLVDYREKYGVPQSQPSVLIHRSGECLCGAFAQKGELEEIEYWFPEMGQYIRDMEKQAETLGKTYCKWGWGHDRRAGVPSPGPLCQGCSLFPEMENP